MSGPGERVFYSSSVHDEAEIAAVVEVLRSGPQGLWPGRRVNAMERQVAALFGKARGVMVNSGSSALYLAVELLAAYPHLTRDDVLAALEYASVVVNEREVPVARPA